MSEYFTLKVAEVVRETADAVTIHFKQPIFKKVKYKAGQFLTVILPINGKKERRSYSMSSAPNLDSYVAITVKRVANGLISNYLNDNIKAGDSIELMEPMGNFSLEPDKNRQRHIVLFGAGSGITPLMSMLKSILYFEQKSTVSLIYGNRNEESIIFAKQLDELKAKFGDRLNIVHVLSQPSHQWGGYIGRIDRVKTVNILNLLPKMPAEQTEYFLCGPTGLTEEVREGLQKLQVSKERIHSESFTAAVATTTENNKKNAGEKLQNQLVTIILANKTHQVNVAANQTILDAALDEGLNMPFSCQSGLCTACRGLCKSGKVQVDGDGLSDSEIKQGYVLTCVGHPLTDDVVIEIG